MRAIALATDGVEDSELNYPYYRLREADVEVDVATPDGESIEGKTGYEFEADHAIDDHEPEWWADEFDLLVIPGGYSPENLRLEAPEAADIVAAFDEADRPIAAICHGAQLLISADVLEGRSVAGYWSLEEDIDNAGAEFVDEEVVVDDTLVTARVPDDLPAFMGETLAQLGIEEEPIAA